jgi:hypothetical protein
MALPRALRPAVIIRNKALYQGILGPSRVWRVIAVWVFGKRFLKRFFGKTPEVLDVSAFGPGHVLTVETTKPITRRRRKQLAKAGTPAPTMAQVRSAAITLALAAAAARRKKR